ncbi:MAG: NIPSNAP family protein [Pseudomonadota bacterium]
MIYELRTYTLKPGTQAAVADNSADLGRDIRGNNYGHLEGYWVTEIGALNQVMHMWSFASLDERARLRAELATNQRWVNEYLPALLPNLVRQEVRLMNAFLPVQPPSTTGNVYELRSYRTRPTRARAWAAAFTKAMPARSRYSTCSGAWICDAGQPNEVCHIWAYPDLNARAAARAGAVADPDWQAFLGEAVGYIEEMSSTIMLPWKHSPMQ